MADTILHVGDCLDVLKTLPEASVHACVTDPPYHLTSIVKRFGAAGASPAQFGTDGAYARASRGFMGKQWDGGDIAFRPELWAEVLRVLKPGAHLLAFGGTRTFHRMAVAIEDAGFELRDTLMWLYGTGFPKSHDVSKGVDAKLGAERGRVVPRSVIAHQRNADNLRPYMSDPNHTTASGEPASDAGRQWQGWGTALKPAWEPIILARKPLVSTVAANVLEFGTGALNIDGCRVGDDGGTKGCTTGPSNGILGDGLIGAFGKPVPGLGRWPANVLHDGSDEVLTSFPTDTRKTQNVYGAMARGSDGAEPRNDTGSAARFFYSAKASKADRAGSKHPTVKPVSLMRYLVRLVTPPGGVVLDPFAGSGTTGRAARDEGFDSTLIERELEYAADIDRRLGLGVMGVFA